MDNQIELHVYIRDPARIAWLKRQPNRSEAVRQAIDTAMQASDTPTLAVIRRAVREELQNITISPKTHNPKPISHTDIDPNAGELLDDMF